MKKITQTLFLVGALALLVISCGNKATSSDPKKVLSEFFERMSKKDVDGAAKLATKDSKSTMDMMKKGLDMAEKMDKDATKDDDPAEDFKDVEFGEAKITGDNALVPVRNKKKSSEIEFPLKKEDGLWKVDFSMSTLMKLGMDAKNKGMDGMNEDGEDVNPEELKKNMEMADSLLKNMDPKKLDQLKKDLEKAKDQ